jgi:hypothetical protein
MGKIAQFRQKSLKWIEFKFQRDDVALEFRIPEPSYMEIQKIQSRLEKKYHISRILKKLKGKDSFDKLNQAEMDTYLAYDLDLMSETVALFEESFPSDSDGRLTMDDLTGEEVAEVFEAARQFFRRLFSPRESTNKITPSPVQEVRDNADQ